MTVIIENFKTDRKWRYLWLQYINGVNLAHHCKMCLLGKTSKKSQTRRKNLKMSSLTQYTIICAEWRLHGA